MREAKLTEVSPDKVDAMLQEIVTGEGAILALSLKPEGASVEIETATKEMSSYDMAIAVLALIDQNNLIDVIQSALLLASMRGQNS